MRYNLKNSRTDNGGVTFATKLPSECVDDPIRTKSHGNVYQFNRSKSWPLTGDVPGWSTTGILEEKCDWTVDNDPCPDGYRLPMKEDFEALLNNSTIERAGGWTASDYGYTVFTSKTNTAKLEIPSVGNRTTASSSFRQGIIGVWWTKNQASDDIGYALAAESSRTVIARGSKTAAFSVRCVRDN